MPKVSEAHLEQRRRQILDAAIACFARKGFRETTMADIADEAGVSDGLAYRYFGGKDEIIETAIREDGGLLDALAPDGGVDDPVTLLGLLLGLNVRRFEQPEEMRATMNLRFRSWAEALHNENIRREILARWRHGLEIVEGLVRRGQERGQIPLRLDAGAVARVMLACHYGLNLQAVLDPDVDLEECKEVMLAMAFGWFGAETEAG